MNEIEKNFDLWPENMRMMWFNIQNMWANS